MPPHLPTGLCGKRGTDVRPDFSCLTGRRDLAVAGHYFYPDVQ